MWHTLTNHPAHQNEGGEKSNAEKPDAKESKTDNKEAKDTKPKDEPKKSDS